MRTCAWLVIVFVVGARAHDAHACDRGRSQYQAIEFAAAVADVIATVTVESVSGGVATATVTKVHAGKLKTRSTIKIREVITLEESAKVGFCGAASMSPGDQRIVLMWNPLGGDDYRLIDEVYGSTDKLDPKPYKAALAKRLPRSTWKDDPSGLRTMIARYPSAKTVDLVVIVRNAGKAALDLTHKYFPPKEHTHCALRVTNVKTKKLVEAKDAYAAESSYGYFEKHGREFTTKLEPGATAQLTLATFTTAKPGWGYKEELGFKHYPVSAAGTYTVAADCKNYLGAGTSFSTEAVTLTLPGP